MTRRARWAVIALVGAAGAAGASAAEPLEVSVRFELAGLSLPAGTTFPRLPAGLPVALVPEVREGGAALSRAAADARGLSLRWVRLEPADPVTSNLQRDPRTGATRLAATPLRWVARPVAAADPWRVDADLLAPAGTARFQVVVDRPGEPAAGATPGPNEQLELEPGVAGGLSPAVYGLSRRSGEELGGAADELAGVPFLFHPLGAPPRHQTEARVGTDCTSTFVYALRRLGFEVPYRGPANAWELLEVRSPPLRLAEDGTYRDAAGSPAGLDALGGRPGDLVHFGRQLSLLAQDRWPFGVLDAHDLLLQAWRSTPHRVTIRESEYAEEEARLVRFRADLPRRAPGLVLRVEDSHAGSFFHLRPALAAGPATLVLLDAHSDAAPNALAAELRRHAPTPEWERGLRARGVIQPFDWIDALLPWGVDRVLWLGPWDEVAPAAEERRAREDLCALARTFPDRGFECRGDHLRAARLEELLALPPATPIVLSVDLDFLLRDGAVDPARVSALHRVLGHFADVRAASAALSRPYFPDDATFARALTAFSAAAWASGRVARIEVDLAEVQRGDRSRRAAELRRAGAPPPRPRPEQIVATPGLHLAAAPAFASFALWGDVFVSDPGRGAPALRSPRPAWQPPERLPILANLETPVVDARPVQGYPVLNQHGDLLDALAREGVLLVSLANNHALDQGPAGLRETIAAARARGLGVVGAWLPGEPAEGVERLRMGDLRVAVLGVTYGLNDGRGFEANVDVVPFESWPPTAGGRAAEARFLGKVRRAAAESDLVVVLAHGGTEYVPGASVGQRRFFGALAAAGAKVIGGAHGHVPAPWEVAGGAVLAWGLGDVLPRPRAAGSALRVTAERGAAGIEVRAEELAPPGR